MYSSSKITLKIPEPCSENWSEMTDSEKGKFCLQCNKEVIDFTQFTDAELLAYFSKIGENQCGRLTPYQLDRAISNEPPRERSLFPKLIFSSVVALFSTKVSVAQKIKEPIEQQLTEIQVIEIREIPKTGVSNPDANCLKDQSLDPEHNSIGRVGGVRVVREPDKDFERQKAFEFLRSLSPW